MPGINVGRVGATYAPSDIAASGAPGIRCTYHPDTPISEGRAWLGQIRARDISVLMVCDNDSHMWEAPNQWRDGITRVRNTYGDLVDVWQVCNEPDAGWIPGPDCPTLEERRAAHPSSWVMSQDDLTNHLKTARDVLGQTATIIGPGLSSGHPEWAADVDWRYVDMLAMHPYLTVPGGANLLSMIVAYSAFGWPVTVTEYDATTPGMHRWMAKNMRSAWTFCWSNQMHPQHGLIERPDCYAEFKEANASEEPEEPIMALPIPVYERVWKSHLPDAEFHPNFGIEKFWMQHYKELGAVTDLAEYRVGKKAWRTFVGDVVEWDDDTGAKIA